MAVKLDASGYLLIKSVADLKALTPDDINRHWKEVSAYLADGGKHLEVADGPQTLADLKGRDADYINAHWPAIIKLLESQAEISAAERKAKAQRNGEAVAA